MKKLEQSQKVSTTPNDSNTSKLNITLKGRIPSKKNSKQIVCRGRFPILLSSPAFQAWNEEQLWLLKALKPSTPLEDVKVDIFLTAPDKRAADLSNKVESIMDLLVEAQILKDDNWFVCGELNLKFMGVDKENPRADIVITKLKRAT
jgi:Holliday junction resolvase RusA-like endonuclease